MTPSGRRNASRLWRRGSCWSSVAIDAGSIDVLISDALPARPASFAAPALAGVVGIAQLLRTGRSALAHGGPRGADVAPARRKGALWPSCRGIALPRWPLPGAL